MTGTADRARLGGLHLHVDGASGAAGDMMLGALLDLGVPEAVVGDALDAIGAGRGRLHVARVITHGIAAVDVKVDTGGELAGAPSHRHSAPEPPRAHSHGPGHGGHAHSHDDHDHAGHSHEHGHGHADRAHVHYAAIRARLAAAELTAGTRRRALDIFDRIARAEARMHGTTVDDVAFHEVGAIDSVVDVVGTAAALDWLDPVAVTCTGVAMGHGTLTCAHGVLPVPAPAALEILRDGGGVMLDGGVSRELCTPTGAAILAASVTRWTAAPAGRPVAIGWGAGDAVLADRANALRVIAIDPAAAAAEPVASLAAEQVWQIDANLDDMNPELCGPASDAVFAAGALDVWWTPITMKKGRPALMLSALATERYRVPVAEAMLRETTTIGVRFAPRERIALARTVREVTTPFGPITVKIAVSGTTIWNAAPEFESCAAAGRRHGVPVKRVFAAAVAAFEAALAAGAIQTSD